MADAAARTIHWLYDRRKLDETVYGKDPVFWPESISPFYTLPAGRRSCYNDMSYVMLQSLSPDSTEDFNPEIYISKMIDFFKAPSEYSDALLLRAEVYSPDK